MKKFLLIFMLGFFVFTSNVKADVVIFTIDRNYMDLHFHEEYLNKAYELIGEYDYKYYVIEYTAFTDSFYLYLSNSDVVSVNQTLDSVEVRQFRNIECLINSTNPNGLCTDYSNIESNSYLMYLYPSSYYYYGYYDSNFDIFANSSVEFSGFYDDNIEVLKGKKFPKLKDLYGHNSWAEYENSNNPKYTTVNLNDYAYIVLSLKDYSKTEAFSSSTFVKGQTCITPVYNFSQSFKPNGSQNICSPVYGDFTKSDLYVLSSDIQNNAVYYVSAYDKSIENYIKIDATVFDVFYITEENKDKPVIKVNGTTYNGIPLDQISYSANKNTENGLIPGESENIADSFVDIIKKPVEFFQDLISGITSFFSLITTFISMMPPVLQSFIYFSFVIAVVLGIIKILV